MNIAIDLGGTHVRVAAGEDGASWRHQHRERRMPGYTPGHLITRLTELFAAWRVTPAAIGVSVAAVVDGDGMLVASENLKWVDVPLRALLAAAFGCPVTVETDVFCGALYEARAGAARGRSSALYIGVGTGVGHAFIFAGKVWRGAQGGANAFGHLVLDPRGAPCYCGHHGCLCTLASGLAQAGQPADTAPLEALALGIGHAVTLIEPEIVILSGGALNQPWFDPAGLAALLPQRAYPAIRLPPIVRSDAADPNLRGALFLSMEPS